MQLWSTPAACSWLVAASSIEGTLTPEKACESKVTWILDAVTSQEVPAARYEEQVQHITYVLSDFQLVGAYRVMAERVDTLRYCRSSLVSAYRPPTSRSFGDLNRDHGWHLTGSSDPEIGFVRCAKDQSKSGNFWTLRCLNLKLLLPVTPSKIIRQSHLIPSRAF